MMTNDRLLAELDGMFSVQAAHAAARIRELIAERDDARERALGLDWVRAAWVRETEVRATVEARSEKAEAEVARLRGLLREARGWLWAPEIHPGHPLPSIIDRIDAALSTEDTP
jgi:peptidyl-tRNA hydrolase